jgi:soluble lytic murein transglycosylase-like protein
MKMLMSSSTKVMAALCGLCLLPAAHAAERIALSNGFDLICNHHAVVEGRVRVYSTAADSSYIELNPETIAAVETIPDPPAEAMTGNTKADAGTIAGGKSAAPQNRDEQLTAADLHQLLSKASSEHNVDEDLLASVVKAESNGHTHAVSHAGARGLMQLMPKTATQLGVSDAFVPEENVRGGSAYLDALLTRYHDSIALALAAYNAGPEAVDRYHGIPPYHETRLYVARVVHEFNRLVAARRVAARRAAVRTASLGQVSAASNRGTGNRGIEMGND